MQILIRKIWIHFRVKNKLLPSKRMNTTTVSPIHFKYRTTFQVKTLDYSIRECAQSNHPYLCIKTALSQRQRMQRYMSGFCVHLVWHLNPTYTVAFTPHLPMALIFQGGIQIIFGIVCCSDRETVQYKLSAVVFCFLQH